MTSACAWTLRTSPATWSVELGVCAAKYHAPSIETYSRASDAATKARTVPLLSSVPRVYGAATMANARDATGELDATTAGMAMCVVAVNWFPLVSVAATRTDST